MPLYPTQSRPTVDSIVRATRAQLLAVPNRYDPLLVDILREQAPMLNGLSQFPAGLVRGNSNSTIELPVNKTGTVGRLNYPTENMTAQKPKVDTIVVPIDRWVGLPSIVSQADLENAFGFYDPMRIVVDSHIQEAAWEIPYIQITRIVGPLLSKTAAGATTSNPLPQANYIKSTGATVAGQKRITYDDLVALNLAADKALMPNVGRRLYVSPEAYSDLLADPQFANTSERSMQIKAEGAISRVLGMDIYQATAMPTYTIGNGGTVTLNDPFANPLDPITVTAGNPCAILLHPNWVRIGRAPLLTFENQPDAYNQSMVVSTSAALAATRLYNNGVFVLVRDDA